MARKIIYYETLSKECPVQDFLDSLDKKTKEKIFSVFHIVKEETIVPKKWFQKMSGTADLWEIRVEWQSNIYRFLGFMHNGNLIILTNGFQKKQQKTSSTEISRAERYKKEYLSRKVK